jgi:pimeloyl-ACP methyl ester carboxylesterase
MDSPSAAYGDAVRHIEHLWITLSDGRRLAARLWLPADAEARPVPAILEYLPYRKRDGTAARDEINYPAFARAGYAGLRVDMAGSGDSDGRLTDEYSEDELASGAEVIAWIAAQSWCSGAVGMIGISWGGFNGLQIAMRRPPALKAVVSVCSTVDRYADDIHFMGGSLLTDNFNWAAQMPAYMTRPPDALLRDDWREVWLQRIESLPFLAVEWLKHQRRDAYWKHGSVCEDWRAIDCPLLAIGGWADAYSDTPARLLEGLSAPVRALVGPWEHEYPNMARIAPAADFHGEVGRWFDRWLKGEDAGLRSAASKLRRAARPLGRRAGLALAQYRPARPASGGGAAAGDARRRCRDRGLAPGPRGHGGPFLPRHAGRQRSRGRPGTRRCAFGMLRRRSVERGGRGLGSAAGRAGTRLRLPAGALGAAALRRGAGRRLDARLLPAVQPDPPGTDTGTRHHWSPVGGTASGSH